ncbi:transposase, partial [Klebsiella pneumoniae]
MSRQRLHHGEDLSAILISPSPPFWSLNACSG